MAFSSRWSALQDSRVKLAETETQDIRGPAATIAALRRECQA